MNECGGEVVLNRKLLRVIADEWSTSVAGLEIQDLTNNSVEILEADEYVLALGLEDFKAVDLGPQLSGLEYFKNIQKLETVSSVSLQAWFKQDPVPKNIDSLICGLPEPFSIVCPVTRVRAVQDERALPLRYEIIATGPEAGFEETDDEWLKTRFLKTLKRCGFKIPEDSTQMHIVMRRNREPFHRYLLTRPGELLLRPVHQSPLRNLCLAGAWVRNSFALPCVDAAAESAIKVATIIADRTKAGFFKGMPRSSPLVMPPPYNFPRSKGVFFIVDAKSEAIKEALPQRLAAIPGLADKILFAAVRHDDVHSPHDPSGGRYGYNEILLAAFVRERGHSALGGFGLYPLHLYVDDDAAMAAGREVYGFPKKMAQINLEPASLLLTRFGMAPNRKPGSVAAIDLITAQWVASSEATTDGVLSILPTPLKTILGLVGKTLSAWPMNGVVSMPFYNVRDMIEPTAGTTRALSTQTVYVRAYDGYRSS